MYVAGLVIRSRPEQRPFIEQQLVAWPGVEIHAVRADGRLVATVEGEERRQVADTILRLNALPGVLNASLVYEESD